MENQNKVYGKTKDQIICELHDKLENIKKSNDSIKADLEIVKNKNHHLVRENVLMKITLEQINESLYSSVEIKNVCNNILNSVDKYKRNEI